ncbi:hypothetical protein G6F22_020614 [Rhizopus arrhizus]|nr:hypothetical protein G6F22_020614 [Rhizopus arrhizus]
MAGWNRSAQGSTPASLWASSRPRNNPGTPTDMPLLTACAKGSGLPCASRKRSGRAAAGAVSRLSTVWMRPVLAEYSTMNAPPPIPEDCGSTRFSTSWVAMAASTTLPPRRSIASPAWVASGLAETIM